MLVLSTRHAIEWPAAIVCDVLDSCQKEIACLRGLAMVVKDSGVVVVGGGSLRSPAASMMQELWAYRELASRGRGSATKTTYTRASRPGTRRRATPGPQHAVSTLTCSAWSSVDHFLLVASIVSTASLALFLFSTCTHSLHYRCDAVRLLHDTRPSALGDISTFSVALSRLQFHRLLVVTNTPHSRAQ